MKLTQGEPIVLKATFTNDSGDPIEPETPVLVTVKGPEGLEVEEEQAQSGDTGIFTYTMSPAHAGPYTYKFTSADGGTEQDRFITRKDGTSL